MSLTGWPVGTIKKFSGTITLNGSTQNITADTITLRLKDAVDDADTAAKMTKTADVGSQGASGIYNFTILPSDTAQIPPKDYYYDIEWVRADEGGEYILDSGMVKLKKRVSDPPSS
ncbi:MAG: hypothetical protein JW932_15545 [Deltaproteobacteria bacterium]|nr:hypothetical protein [Deltaproteobacteria bacterium]